MLKGQHGPHNPLAGHRLIGDWWVTVGQIGGLIGSQMANGPALAHLF